MSRMYTVGVEKAMPPILYVVKSWSDAPPLDPTSSHGQYMVLSSPPTWGPKNEGTRFATTFIGHPCAYDIAVDQANKAPKPARVVRLAPKDRTLGIEIMISTGQATLPGVSAADYDLQRTLAAVRAHPDVLRVVPAHVAGKNLFARLSFDVTVRSRGEHRRPTTKLVLEVAKDLMCILGVYRAEPRYVERPKRLEVLLTEMSFFERELPNLLKHHAGKYALIKGPWLIDVFDTSSAAYAAGVSKLGNVPMLIRQVLVEQPVPVILMDTMTVSSGLV